MLFYKTPVLSNLHEQFVVEKDSPRYLSVIQVNKRKEYAARVPFGMNFFIGIIGLVLISATKKFYYIEVGVQVFFGILIFISFFYGTQGNIIFLQISDMASIYFLPLSSLFMVVLAFIEKKSLQQKDEA